MNSVRKSSRNSVSSFNLQILSKLCFVFLLLYLVTALEFNPFFKQAQWKYPPHTLMCFDTDTVRVPQRASVCCFLLPDCLLSARTQQEGDFPSFHKERWQYGLGQRSDPADALRSEEELEREKRLMKLQIHTQQIKAPIESIWASGMFCNLYNSSKVRLS